MQIPSSAMVAHFAHRDQPFRRIVIARFAAS